MKAFKKIYSRLFQGVMRSMINLFPYREPKILDTLGDIIQVLKEKGKGKVILVTDKGIRNLGLTTPLEQLLEEEGIGCVVYDNTVANPTSQNVEEARALYVGEGCEAIIAFGGGSAMDCAKAVGARVARPKKPLKKMAGLIKICATIPLLIAVPTTAGTGSEATVASVIVDADTHHKYVINDFCLIPSYALLDPQITSSLPKRLTATTGMDALTHAVEVLVGQSKTKKTKAAAMQAVKLILDNLENAYADGSNLEARKNMLHASYLAGVAFTRSYVGYVHAVAHTLGGQYGVEHGLANAVLLPQVLRAYGSAVYASLGNLARVTGLAKEDMSNQEAAEIFISYIEGMNARMQIPSTLSCVLKADIPSMAVLADREANPLYPVPVLWNAKELEHLYHMICEDM